MAGIICFVVGVVVHLVRHIRVGTTADRVTNVMLELTWCSMTLAVGWVLVVMGVAFWALAGVTGL